MKSSRMPLSASVKPSVSVKPSMSASRMFRLVEDPLVQELLPSGLEGHDSSRDGPYLVADAARERLSCSDSSDEACQRPLVTNDMVAVAQAIGEYDLLANPRRA